MEFLDREDANGIRFSLNVWPTNRIDAVSVSVPIGALYTPLKRIPNLQPLPYEPTTCRNCQAVLNSYCNVDYNSKIWTCPICQNRAPLPQMYHQINPQCLPAELHPDFTTVEYSLPSYNSAPPAFLLVVDTATKEREFSRMKDILMQTVSSIPPDAYVGLITFGNLVYIHELLDNEFPRSYVFSGNKTYTATDLMRLLSIKASTGTDSCAPFFLPLAEAELMVNNIIDKLERDSQAVPKEERHPRCTGTAMHMAVTLMESIFPSSGGQIMIFTSGPITKGPGAMAKVLVTEPVRQHIDIEKDKAPMTKEASVFFNDLAEKAAERNIVINYLSGNFEEAGLYEVEPCILKTGGWLLSCESWADQNISPTITKYFDTIYPVAGTDCSVTINCSRQFKIAGCIGPCTSKRRAGDIVSEKQIGIGGTTEWKLCGALPSTTLAFYVDINASKADPVPSGTPAFIQFASRYRHLASGTYRLRVTTTAIQFADLATSKHLIDPSFDQEAATVLLARLAMWRVRDEDLIDVIQFLDKTLIRFCRKFGTFNKGDPLSFSLSSSFNVFPQFMYHLRRSPFMSTFNSSPDLTASLRHSLLCEDTANSLFMIQPTLTQYKLDKEPTPVLLDVQSLDKTCVLILDTFFKVVVWHGSDVAAWRDAGYAEKPEYANIKALLEEPLAEAQELIKERFPTPLLISCDQDSSEARFVLARCNPSTASYDGLGRNGMRENLGSDEPSYARFFTKLKEVAVTD